MLAKTTLVGIFPFLRRKGGLMYSSRREGDYSSFKSTTLSTSSIEVIPLNIFTSPSWCIERIPCVLATFLISLSLGLVGIIFSIASSVLIADIKFLTEKKDFLHRQLALEFWELWDL